MICYAVKNGGVLKMYRFQINSLPKINFAHIYNADKYTNNFRKSNSSIEITYISQGTMKITSKNNVIFLNKGDIFFNQYNEALKIESSDFHEHHTVCMMLDYVDAPDGEGLYLPIITRSASSLTSVYNAIDNIIINIIDYKENPVKGALKSLDLLCKLDECNRKLRDRSLPSAALYTQRAKEFLHKNIHAQITQKDVADHLGISTEYLCAVFKKTEGIPLIKYYNITKLREIKTLIDNKTVKLSEASAIYGYNDPNYVSRLFKQYFGYNITKK